MADKCLYPIDIFIFNNNISMLAGYVSVASECRSRHLSQPETIGYFYQQDS